MKIILTRLPIILMVLYSIPYSIEISQDTVEQQHINSDLYLYITNKENIEIKIDSMKIILISGSCFHEMYIDFAVLNSTSDPYPEIINVYSLLIKENDSTYKMTNYRNTKNENITLSIPAKKIVQFYNLETGTNLGPQIVSNSLQPLKKINETLDFDYTVKLIFYQNGDISDYVIIKGYILINNSIVKNKTTIVKPVYNNQGKNINLLGRTINRGSFLLCNNIVIFQNNEKKLLFNKLQ